MPAPRNPLFGRHDELARLRVWLASPGLVTVQGPGGAGKTRLSRELRAERPDAVSVALADVRTPELLVSTVAHALGCAPEADAVTRALAHRGPLLLVLDNLEQLVGHAARFVSQLLDGAPQVTVLATSRLRLEIDGERVLAVGPLPEGEALALLRERIARRAPALALSDDALRPVVAAVDGLPLGLELAAARIPALGVAGVLAALSRRLDALTDTGPDRPEHHRSLGAAIVGSWALLSAPERRALRWVGALSTFVAADLVGFPEPDLLLHVGALVDAGLLRVEHGDEATWHHYETVRAFVREQTPDDDPVHAEIVAALCAVAEPARAALNGPGVAAALAQSMRLRVPLMEAAERADRAGRVEDFARLVIVLDAVLHQVGPGGWRERQLQRVRTLLPPEHPHHADALLSLVMTGGQPVADDVFDLPAAVRTPARVSRAEVARAKHLFDQHRLAEATEVAIAAHRAAPRHETRVFLGACWILGGIHAASGRLAEARAAYAEGLHVARDARSPVDEGLFLGQLGSVLLDIGDDDALRSLSAGVSLLARHHDFRRALWMLRLGELQVDGGRLGEAFAAVDGALEVMRAAGQLRFEGYALGVRARVLEASGAVREALDTFDRARGQGGHALLGATIDAWYGQALADAGERSAAEAAIGRAAAVFARTGGKLVRLPDLCGAHGWLLEARAEEAAGRDPEPLRSRVQALLAEVVPRAHEVRAAHHRLSDALARDRGPDGVVAAADGTWFQHGGRRTDLATRHPIRRVFLALVAAHPDADGLGVDALFEAGWPGERAHPDAARDRVYHAVGTLRRAGLQEVLERTEKGWRLRPGVPVRQG